MADPTNVYQHYATEPWRKLYELFNKIPLQQVDYRGPSPANMGQPARSWNPEVFNPKLVPPLQQYNPQVSAGPSPLQAALATLPGSLAGVAQNIHMYAPRGSATIPAGSMPASPSGPSPLRAALASRPGYTSADDLARSTQTPVEQRANAYVAPGKNAYLDAEINSLLGGIDAQGEAIKAAYNQSPEGHLSQGRINALQQQRAAYAPRGTTQADWDDMAMLAGNGNPEVGRAVLARMEFERARTSSNAPWQPMVGTQGLQTPIPETREQQWARLLADLPERAAAAKEGMDRYGKVLPWMTSGADRLDSRRQAVVDAERLSPAEWQAKYPGMARSEFQPGGEYHLTLPSEAVSASGSVQPVADYYSRDFWRSRREQVRNFKETGDREYSLGDLQKEAQKTLSPYAGKKLTDEGKEQYRQFQGALKSIVNSPLRGRKKADALRTFMANVESSGLGDYVVKDLSLEESFNKNVKIVDGVAFTRSVKDGVEKWDVKPMPAKEPADFAGWLGTPEGTKALAAKTEEMNAAANMAKQAPPTIEERLKALNEDYDAIRNYGKPKPGGLPSPGDPGFVGYGPRVEYAAPGRGTATSDTMSPPPVLPPAPQGDIMSPPAAGATPSVGPNLSLSYPDVTPEKAVAAKVMNDPNWQPAEGDMFKMPDTGEYYIVRNGQPVPIPPVVIEQAIARTQNTSNASWASTAGQTDFTPSGG